MRSVQPSAEEVSRLEVLERERSSPCPYGLPRVSPEEIETGAKAILRSSGHFVSEQAARNAAYSVLLAIRARHFDWHVERLREERSRGS